MSIPNIFLNNDRIHFHWVGYRDCLCDFISQDLYAPNLIFWIFPSPLAIKYECVRISNVKLGIFPGTRIYQKLSCCCCCLLMGIPHSKEMFEYKFIIIFLPFTCTHFPNLLNQYRTFSTFQIFVLQFSLLFCANESSRRSHNFKNFQSALFN